MIRWGGLLKTGHAEPALLQRTIAESRYHFRDISGDATDQVNVGLPQQVVERLAHSTADDETDPQLFEFGHPFEN